MHIYKVQQDKKQHLGLLLLADEAEHMIDCYLEAGDLYVLEEECVLCVAVVLPLNGTECELKNLAVAPAWQGRGYGSAMVAFLKQIYLGRYKTMYVGTGDVPRTVGFYKKCGFRPAHRVAGFFTQHYSHPIIEDGVQLVDMVYLRADAP